MSSWLVLAAMTALTPMPPDAPDSTESVISGVNDPIADRCASGAATMRKHMKTTQLKVVITHSPKWGTIWRQDEAFPVDHPTDKPIVFRTTCYKDAEDIRPLEMFDRKASIPPLK